MIPFKTSHIYLPHRQALIVLHSVSSSQDRLYIITAPGQLDNSTCWSSWLFISRFMCACF